MSSVSFFPTLSLIVLRRESFVLPDLFSLEGLRGTTENPFLSFQVTLPWVGLIPV